MITLAKPREGEGDWADQDLRTLENEELGYVPKLEWCKVVCFDGEQTGLYVLTDDDDNYFTCHSIVLDFKDEPETDGERRLAFDSESEEATYTIVTPDGKTYFMWGYPMYAVYKEALRKHGDGVLIRPSWYGEWDCATEELARKKGEGCWYDKFGNHHKLKDGRLVNG